MRSVPEWIGANDDSPIPHRVRLRRFNQANGRCEKCGHRIAVGESWQCDHIIALCNGGENRERNLRLLCELCHKAKTRSDVAEKSKVARVRGKHLGLKKPRRITVWRNFNNDIVIAPRDRNNRKRKIIYARER